MNSTSSANQKIQAFFAKHPKLRFRKLMETLFFTLKFKRIKLFLEKFKLNFFVQIKLFLKLDYFLPSFLKFFKANLFYFLFFCAQFFYLLLYPPGTVLVQVIIFQMEKPRVKEWQVSVTLKLNSDISSKKFHAPCLNLALLT